jgi:SAM-dependent methyltransferase
MKVIGVARVENVKPISVLIQPGNLGALKFWIRRSVDLQLLTIWRVLKPELLKVKGSLLDVGCGEMPFRFALHPDVVYTGIDVEEALAFGMTDNSAIQAFDGRNIPFPDNHFDNVLCTEVLEHAEAPEQLLNEMHRVLQPGGTLILTVPFAARVHHAPYDFHRFTIYKLETLFRPFARATIAPRGNDVATIANKLIVLMMRLLQPSLHLIWCLPLAVALAPVAALFCLAAHFMIAFGLGSVDDPLGYSVIAHK